MLRRASIAALLFVFACGGATPAMAQTTNGVITQEQMQMLPLASRQPMDLALLMPGTSQDAVRARKANSNVGG